MRQCTSLLSSVTALLIAPVNVYLSTLILPASQYSQSACTRAFGASGRLGKVAGKHWPGGYVYRPFVIKTTDREFVYSRRSGPIDHARIPSNISCVCTPHLQQTLIGGRLPGRKRGDVRAASAISRRGMWSAAARVIALLGLPTLEAALAGGPDRSYRGLKEHELLQLRRNVKADLTDQALQRWAPNVVDDFPLPVEPVMNVTLPQGD